MKTQLFALFCLFSVILFAEEQFDSDKWNSFFKKAIEETEKEFGDEFVINKTFWESRKGVCFFVEKLAAGRLIRGRNSTRTYMKFDSDGRLVKVASEEEFPELVRFENRRKELLKQLKEEYAKSLGITIEECEKKSRAKFEGAIVSRLTPNKQTDEEKKEAEKKKQQERAELLPKIEQFVGYKFGQLPMEGVTVETNMTYSLGALLSDGVGEEKMVQTADLVNPYRYMKKAKLTYRYNQLCEIELYVDFGNAYSDESIDQESEIIKKDLSERFGMKFQDLHNCGGFEISVETLHKKLSIIFSDEQRKIAVKEAEKEAKRKQGRALPTIEDWKKEETLKEEEKAREESARLAQQKEQEEKRKAAQEAEKKRQAEERAKMREELAALSEEVRQAREEREAKESESSVELRKKVEQFTGYKFGSSPIEGNGTKIRSYTTENDIEVQEFETKLAKPYRYMKDVRLTYWNNELCHIQMFVKFDKEYSVESIGEEFEAMKKDIVSKFELGDQYGKHNMLRPNRSRRGKDNLGIDFANSNKELRLTFTDYQIRKDIENAAQEVARKRGRKLPKFEEAK